MIAKPSDESEEAEEQPTGGATTVGGHTGSSGETKPIMEEGKNLERE